MATPAGILFYDGQAKPFSTAGQFMAGCYLQFFLTGTTTPSNVFADGALTTPLNQTPGAAQPSCTADSAGRFNPIYMSPSLGPYRYRLFSQLGVMLEDIDPYVVPTNTNSIVANLINPATGFGADLVANAVRSYDVVTSVRAANVPVLAAGQTLIIILEGGAAVGDGLGGTFYWSASSAAADDSGTTTIKPTAAGATGRFLRLSTIASNLGGVAANAVTLTANTVNMNLFQLLGSPAGVVTASLTIPAGVRIVATDNEAVALDLSGFTAGSTITLTNNGFILAHGGDGGTGGELGGSGGSTTDRSNAYPGRNGGNAIVCGPAGVTVTINNSAGFIWGGGGGGGGGGGTVSGVNQNSNGGGGGGGAGGSKGGYGGNSAAQTGANGSSGGDGVWLVAGANGAGGAGTTVGGTANAGGAGGDWGANGTAGAGNANDGANNTGFGAAGTGGNAIVKNGATVNFNSGAAAPNVKGAVS